MTMHFPGYEDGVGTAHSSSWSASPSTSSRSTSPGWGAGRWHVIKSMSSEPRQLMMPSSLLTYQLIGSLCGLKPPAGGRNSVLLLKPRVWIPALLSSGRTTLPKFLNFPESLLLPCRTGTLLTWKNTLEIHMAVNIAIAISSLYY